MNSGAVDNVTGRKAPTLILIGMVLLIVAGVLGAVIWVFKRGNDRMRQTEETRAQVYAGGGIGPTMATLKNDNRTPEELEAERATTLWRRSLSLPEDELAEREARARAANAPEQKPVERKPKDVSLGSESVLQDIVGAQAGPLLGTSEARTAMARDGSVRLDIPAGGPADKGPLNLSAPDSQANETGAVPVPRSYMPLSVRMAIAAQQESGPSGGTDQSASKDTSPMVTYNVPTDVAPPPPPTTNATAAKPVQKQMPVNIVAPWTIPIQCTFYNNFIASGAGADTSQVVIATVEQDVFARNRLQIPRGAKLIGTSGGVRDLDLVDVTFHTMQFPDLTRVAIKGSAYQPFSPEAPENMGMKGVLGEYVAPDLPKQLMPIFIAAMQGAAKSNLERMNGAQFDNNGNQIVVKTSDKDRLYGAASSALDKVAEIVTEKLKRYRAYVRVRAGQPLTVLLDDYVDVSKRDIMGFEDPLKQISTQVSLGAETPTDGTSGPGINMPTQEQVGSAMQSLSPQQMDDLVKYLKQTPGAGAVTGVGN